METDPVSGIRMVSPPGPYADGAESELLSIMEATTDRSSRSDELAARIHDWPTRYHLSKLRSNLVRPLKMGPGIRVLDVGAGTGAIARYVGETGADVVALEGSLERARVANERCSDLANVEVICGDVLDYEDERGFDLILVVGVLEYAAAAPDGAAGFLGAISGLLGPEGAVAIAIENQLGLKYLVGFAEDHVGEIFAGVEGYRGHDVARTFSRATLQRLLTESGLGHQKWLYPFPDYKLPTTLLGEEVYRHPEVATLVDQLVRSPVLDLHRKRVLLADDRAVHRVFLEAGLGEDVANSFFVVSARAPEALEDRVGPPDARAWLFGSERMSMWLRDRVVAGFDSDWAVKTIDDDTKPIRERGWLSQAVPAEEQFASGRTLEQLAFDACAAADVDLLQSLLERWKDRLESEARDVTEVDPANPFLSTKTHRLLPAEYLDSNLDNFIAIGDDLVFIDAEWQALGGADLRIVLIRGLWWFAQRLIQSGSPHPWSAVSTADQLVITLGKLAEIPVGVDGIEHWRKAEAEFQSLVQDRDLDTAIRHVEMLGSRTRMDYQGAGRLPYTALRREATSAVTELKRERAQLEETARNLEEAERRIHDLMPRFESAVNRARDAERQAERTEKAAAELRTGNERLRQEIRDRIAASQEARETSEREISNFSRKLASAESQINKLRSERDGLRRSYERLRNRRVVRFGLGASKLMTPAFRLRRGKRSRRASSPGPPAKKTTKSGDTGPAATASGPGFSDITPIAAPLLESRPALDSITIVVPVYNAYEDLVVCLQAIVANTYAPARLLLIDDASTDERIWPLLKKYADHPNVTALQNLENLGFTGTVNRGFAETAGDVVIVNSDAIVTPRWLTRMQLTAMRRPRAATVTAVSNNAGAFSVPETGANDIPPSSSLDQLGRALAQRGSRAAPTGPTGNGFCMLIRRSALNEIGLFDYEAFPRGYGEENDWCMRAQRAGWDHAVDGTTLVFHGNAASFGEEAKAALGKEARKIIDARYPEYTGLVRSMMASPEIATVRSAARDVFEDASNGGRPPRPAILFVLHAGRGGTPATNLDLMKSLESRYDPYLLTSNGRDLALSRLVDGELSTTLSWRLTTPISVIDETRSDYRQILTEILDRFTIELIHIRHLIGHTFDIGSVAKGLGVPVVLSFHDFYFVCPTVHLLDENDVFCGGTCTPGQGKCRIPTKWLQPVPHLKHDWVSVWKQRASALFANVDAFVTTSDSARSTYSGVYPELTEQRFRLIEHGRDLDVSGMEAGITPGPSGPIKIVVPGNLAVHKGSRLIEQLKEHDLDNRIEFHFLGDVPEESKGLGIVHGSYERDEFADLVADIGPAFVAVFTIAGETYSHVITEAWASGVPVLVTALGAQQERVLRHGAGWIVDHSRPEAAYRVILDAVSDPAEYERRRSLCQPAAARTVAEMAADYAQLYEEVWDARRPFAVQPAAATPPLRVALFVVGGNGSHPGSVHVRTLRRWMHPDLRRDAVAQVISVDRFLQDPDAFKPDLALVQRTAIDPNLVPNFIDVCKARSIPIVFDLDDDLINVPSDSVSCEVYRPFRESLLDLAGNCALMTVSTRPLRARMGSLSPDIAIVPNHIDEQLWMRPLLPVEPSPRLLRLLYFGTDTHGEDMAMLQYAVKSLEGVVELYVIGGEPPNEEADWYERIAIPPGHSSYPRFARWLAEMRGDFDAAVIPLVDNEFNRCKSDLKFLEMAALGLPVLASDVVPYSKTIRHHETGLLVRNTTGDWTNALKQIAADPGLREQLRIAAYNYVAENRTLANTVSDYFETVSQALHRDGDAPS